MTLKELSGLYYINNQIKSIESEIASLRESAERITSYISDMPKGSGCADKLSATLALIADREIELAELAAEKAEQAVKIGRYINSIDDSLTQTIFRLRFISLLSWSDVAAKTGSSYSAVKKICYRYLRSH